MDHLDEVPRTVRPAVQIALFCGAGRVITPRRVSGGTGAWRQRGEHRLKVLNDGIFAANHQAVAAVEAGNAATGANVYMVYAFGA